VFEYRIVQFWFSNGVPAMASHLTLAEREFIVEQRAAGRTWAWLSRTLGRDVSSFYRERKRNAVQGHYSPSQADQCAKQRRCNARRNAAKMRRPQLRRFVLSGLRKRWSPEQIAARSQQVFAADRRLQVSRQTLYNWIHTDDHRQRWERMLRRYRRYRRRKPVHPKEWSRIKQRPAIIHERGRYGDWEGDTIVSPLSRGGLVSLVERRSRHLELIYVERLTTKLVTRAIARRLRKYPPHLRLSITFDRGREFAAHAWLKKQLGIEVYFADPGKPWQRGTNENTNGLVRDYFPKGTQFRTISPERIAKVEDALNLRPRKCLGFQTPHKTLFAQCYRAIQT
jgi:IS30 family transposase